MLPVTSFWVFFNFCTSSFKTAELVVMDYGRYNSKTSLVDPQFPASALEVGTMEKLSTRWILKNTVLKWVHKMESTYFVVLYDSTSLVWHLFHGISHNNSGFMGKPLDIDQSASCSHQKQ